MEDGVSDVWCLHQKLQNPGCGPRRLIHCRMMVDELRFVVLRSVPWHNPGVLEQDIKPKQIPSYVQNLNLKKTDVIIKDLKLLLFYISSNCLIREGQGITHIYSQIELRVKPVPSLPFSLSRSPNWPPLKGRQLPLAAARSLLPPPAAFSLCEEVHGRVRDARPGTERPHPWTGE